MRAGIAVIGGLVALLSAGVGSGQEGPAVDVPEIREPDAVPGSGCTHQGRPYPEGAVICKDGFQQKCSDGGWENRGFECPPDDTGVDGRPVRPPTELQPPPPDQPLAPEALEPAEP